MVHAPLNYECHSSTEKAQTTGPVFKGFAIRRDARDRTLLPYREQ
jgi:hypothetical protein